MKDVTLIGSDAAGGHACGLSLGLRKYCNLTTVWLNHNLHGLDSLDPEAMIGSENLHTRGGHELIIVSNVTYDLLNRRHPDLQGFMARYDVVKIIITDDYILKKPEVYNAKMRGMEVFSVPHTISAVNDPGVTEYYQPFDLSFVEIIKTTALTVSHSPFSESKKREKGTEGIQCRIHGKYKGAVELDVISGVDWYEALRRKAMSHMFVDQISSCRDNGIYKVPMESGLGKSGIEAMHLKSLVFTRGFYKGRGIPSPPVVWLNGGNLIKAMDRYVKNTDELNLQVEKQYKWAMTYATHDFAARNLLRL